MSEPRANLGIGALALVPIACCVGIPLIAAAGISAAVAAWVGGIAIGAVLLVVVVVLLAVRLRRRHDRRVLPSSIVRGRS
jgi:hypothetical protein